MIRTVVAVSKLAALAAGGSFLLLGQAMAAPAQDAAPASAPSQPALLAGSARLNIAPLRIELDGAKTGATVMLTNTSDRVLAVQSRLFAWSQEAGEDRFAPSTALTISPSIISIAPGTTQVVRLLRTGAASPGEKRFRLAVDQLPDPELAKGGQAEARLRFTLPVFLDRDTAGPAQLGWKLYSDRLELTNAGDATARVLSVKVRTAAGSDVALARNSLRYVLGKSAITWNLTGGCALGPVTISALVDGQQANAQVSPTCG